MAFRSSCNHCAFKVNFDQLPYHLKIDIKKHLESELEIYGVSVFLCNILPVIVRLLDSLDLSIDFDPDSGEIIVR